MKNINYSHEFVYFRKNEKIPARIVSCTENEKIESAMSIMKYLNACKVIKVPKSFKIGDDISYLLKNNNEK